jgi:hypothetical protein
MYKNTTNDTFDIFISDVTIQLDNLQEQAYETWAHFNVDNANEETKKAVDSLTNDILPNFKENVNLLFLSNS